MKPFSDLRLDLGYILPLETFKCTNSCVIPLHFPFSHISPHFNLLQFHFVLILITESRLRVWDISSFISWGIYFPKFSNILQLEGFYKLKVSINGSDKWLMNYKSFRKFKWFDKFHYKVKFFEDRVGLTLWRKHWWKEQKWSECVTHSKKFWKTF